MTLSHTRPMVPLERLRPTVETFAGVTFARQLVNPAAISLTAILTRVLDDGTTTTTHVDSNGSTWGGEGPRPLDALVERLRTEPLDRARFGRFAYQLTSKDLHRAHQDRVGMWQFFGNFANWSHVFYIATNDVHVSDILRAEVRANQARSSYRALPAYVPPSRRRSFR